MRFPSRPPPQVQRAHHADDVRDPHRGERGGHLPHVLRAVVRHARGRRPDRAVPARGEEEEKGLCRRCCQPQTQCRVGHHQHTPPDPRIRFEFPASLTAAGSAALDQVNSQTPTRGSAYKE